jgi:hypothetical protein
MTRSPYGSIKPCFRVSSRAAPIRSASRAPPQPAGAPGVDRSQPGPELSPQRQQRHDIGECQMRAKPCQHLELQSPGSRRGAIVTMGMTYPDVVFEQSVEPAQ